MIWWLFEIVSDYKTRKFNFYFYHYFFMYTRKHLISLLGYLGIWFIGWSISHWFFSWTRSIVMATLGIILFILSEYLQWGEKNYGHLIIGWLIYSVAVGMVSWWFQHFLDSPMRSLWIIPVGWIISTVIFPYKESLENYDWKKSIGLWLIISIVLCAMLYALVHILPQSIFAWWDHHGWTTATTWTHDEATTTDSDHNEDKETKHD